MSGKERTSPAISVIMPVYNSQQYVGATIESLLEQDFRDFELLLVDDGSKDRSGIICDEYAQKDERIRVIHQENGGICKARNRGLQEAKGVYIAFSDNDDKCLPGFLKENFEKAEAEKADVVRFLREHTFLKGGEIIRREVITPKCELLVTPDNFAEQYYDLLKVCGGIWTGLYRRELLEQNQIRFHEGIKFGYEDVYFNLEVLRAANKVAINPKVYYQWIERMEHSTSRKFSKNRLYAIEECLKCEEGLNQKYQIEEQNSDIWLSHLIDTYVYRILQQISRDECKMSMKEKTDFLKYFRETYFTDEKNKGLTKSIRKMVTKTKLIYLLFIKGYMRTLVILFRVNAILNKKR